MQPARVLVYYTRGQGFDSPISPPNLHLLVTYLLKRCFFHFKIFLKINFIFKILGLI